VILAAVVATAPAGVVARHRPRLRVAPSVSVYDIAGVTIRGLTARVKDPLLDRRLTLVGELPRYATRLDGRLLTLGAAVVPRADLLAYAGCRAFGLLHDRLLDERCASWCRFRASGVEGAGMARSSVAAVMSFWLARGGVFGSSTLKLVLMRSWACLPSSHTRSQRAEASPAMEACSNRTVRYSSASLASGSRA
jgi:hypothetical protein